MWSLLTFGLVRFRRFLYFYRDIGGTIYPVLADVVEFEEKLNMLLHNRSAAGGVYKSNDNQSQRPFGVSLAYIGLLFAVLASGCQSSDLPSKERELTSQVYGELSCYGMQQCSIILTTLRSMLLLPMLAHDQFLIATYDRGHPNASYHRECIVLQYESRCLLCPARYGHSILLSVPFRVYLTVW